MISVGLKPIQATIQEYKTAPNAGDVMLSLRTAESRNPLSSNGEDVERGSVAVKRTLILSFVLIGGGSVIPS